MVKQDLIKELELQKTGKTYLLMIEALSAIMN